MSEAYNPIRRFMRIQGIRGKAKKKFRKGLSQNTSAKNALELAEKERLTLGGLVNVQSQGAGPHRP